MQCDALHTMTLEPGWIDSLNVPRLFCWVICVYLIRKARVALSGTGICPLHSLQDTGPNTLDEL